METDETNSENATPKPSSAELSSVIQEAKAFSAKLLNLLLDALKTGDFGPVEELCSTLDLSHVENEKPYERIHDDVELYLKRWVITHATKGELDLDVCRNVVRIVKHFSKQPGCGPKIFGPLLPANFFIELVDLLSIESIEKVFGVMEEFRDDWSTTFGDHSKNQTLRVCNCLLKRLSKSQNTAFCSRVLQFLCSITPPSERSGLNIIGEFNLENVTLYSVKPETEKSKDPGAKPIESKIYETFWGLQDFFRNPLSIFTGSNQKKFKESIDEVFRTLRAYKLDHVPTNPTGTGAGTAAAAAPSQRMEVCEQPGQVFAKYLTNQKLMDLEIRDSTFRRSFLMQFLIVAQYVLCNSKFKHEKFNLIGVQRNWYLKMSKLAFRLIRETPPDGPKAAAMLRKILSEERRWIAWKNTGCKASTRVSSYAPGSEPWAPINLEIDATEKESAPTTSTASEKYAFGKSKIKAKVFNKDPAMTAMDKLCAFPKKNQFAFSKFGVVTPSAETFFKDVMPHVHQNKLPAKAQKLLANPTFTWRGMRLARSKTSKNFFIPPVGFKSKPMDVGEYLVEYLKRTRGDVSLSGTQTPSEPSAATASAASSTAPKTSEEPTPEVRSPKKVPEQPAKNGPVDNVEAAENASADKEKDGGGEENGEDEDSDDESLASNLALVDEVGDEDMEEDVLEKREETPVDEALIKVLAPQIAAKYREVGKALRYKEDEMDAWLQEYEGDLVKASRRMLQCWTEIEEPELAILEHLRYLCEGCDLTLAV